MISGCISTPAAINKLLYMASSSTSNYIECIRKSHDLEFRKSRTALGLEEPEKTEKVAMIPTQS